jgi:hypothetical protein
MTNSRKVNIKRRINEINIFKLIIRNINQINCIDLKDKKRITRLVDDLIYINKHFRIVKLSKK